MTPAISFSSVVKRYETIEALRALTFEVRPGEMFGLIGPDGAGKTTRGALIRPVARLTK